jgi:hypothetical protein
MQMLANIDEDVKLSQDVRMLSMVIVMIDELNVNVYLIQVKASLVELIDQTMIAVFVVGVIFDVSIVQKSFCSVSDQMADQFQVVLKVLDNKFAAIQHIIQSFFQTIGE